MRTMSTTGYAYTFFGALTTGLLTTGMILPADSQVISDETTNTVVNQNGNNFTILNGIEKGNNLFHSFSNFSVPVGGEATFDLKHTPNITTIFSRVTGGNVSDIQGLISTLNNNSNPVSLFLMNPAGIVFGKDAALNIGGSFVGTTANSIKFSDGTEFSAVNPGSPPLLTMSVPIGLQMGVNARDIRVEGYGHSISRLGPSLLNRGTYTTGLSVTPDHTLSLIGGNVNLVGGLLFAESGKIEIGALSNGVWNLGASQGFSTVTSTPSTEFGTLQFNNGAMIDVSGSPAGSVNLQGGQIRLQQGATIISQNLGTQASGSIQVNARDRLELSGFNASVSSRIVTQPLSSGSGSDISIFAPQIKLDGGGTILSQTFGSGSSGQVIIQAPDFLEMKGFSAANFYDLSAISTATFSTGETGNLTISTGRLQIRGGAQITAPTVGSGNGGLLTVTATDLVDIAGNSPLSNSALVANSFGSGDAGSIIINTPTLRLTDLGGIVSIAYSSGNAGNIVVNATKQVEISSTDNAFAFIGGINSSVMPAYQDLRVILGLPDIPTGNSGNIKINTPKLLINRLGQVTVENSGPGNSGSIEIHANSIQLNEQASINALTNLGRGGNITLQTQDLLLLRYGSFITTTSGGIEDSGNITINSPIILGLENSDIIANAFQGNGGKIDITTQGIIGLQYRNTLTPREDPTNDITSSSKFNLNGEVIINNIGVDPNSGLIELAGNLTDSSQQIASGCAGNESSSFVATGRGGIPQNPTKEVNSNHTWSDIRDISAYLKNSTVTAQIPPSPQILVQATGWRRNPQGKIELFADKSPTVMQQALTCAAIPQR